MICPVLCLAPVITLTFLQRGASWSFYHEAIADICCYKGMCFKKCFWRPFTDWLFFLKNDCDFLSFLSCDHFIMLRVLAVGLWQSLFVVDDSFCSCAQKLFSPQNLYLTSFCKYDIAAAFLSSLLVSLFVEHCFQWLFPLRREFGGMR